MPRDMSWAEFRAAYERAGFVSTGFMGYYRLPNAPHVSVSVLNAGPKLRARLAYLHRENDKYPTADKGKD